MLGDGNQARGSPLPGLVENVPVRGIDAGEVAYFPPGRRMTSIATSEWSSGRIGHRP